MASLCWMLHYAQAIPLLNGRFETTTDVQYLLNLALDAAAMKESDNIDAKNAIYQFVSFPAQCSI